MNLSRITAFAPVVRTDANVLILGSMPSEASLAQGFYYGHPRNAFWRILSDVFSCPLPGSIEEKREMLEEHRVALWDVLQSCIREGSLDSAIQEPFVNDFTGLFERCGGLRRILFNGTTAFRLFDKHVQGVPEGCQRLLMPSTSPAYTLSYERKLALWRQGLEQ